MRITHFIGLSLVAILAVHSAGCAPVDSVGENKNTGSETAPKIDPSFGKPDPLHTNSTADGQILKIRIESAIEQVRRRELLLSNGFWTVFHGILGLGPSFTLKDPILGTPVNAIDYIRNGGELRGMRFIPSEYGVDVETGEMFVSQGHQDQFVAEMAQCGMPADREFTILGKKYKFLDFVRYSQMRARTSSDQELSWTIIVVGQYLGTDLSWTNSFGEKLTYEDLIGYEVNANVDQAACGGTHRLFGLKWASNLYQRNGGKVIGVWQDLLDEQDKYRDVARKYQNPDGSFSTDFFRGPGNVTDMQLRMNSTGHILEWLAYTLPQEQLHQEWIERAVNRLTLMFLEIQDKSMESGTLYHAVHGLRIYHERVFGGEGLGAQKPFLITASR